MSTALDTDIATFVGEMPAQPCEHSEHGVKGKAHDDGPATHYVRSHCVCEANTEGTLYAACAGFVNFIHSGAPGYCSDCGWRGQINDLVTVLGPVNK